MTTPTPAQIEAAANAMIDCMFAPHELPLDGELQGKYYETAKAALIAAAEVVHREIEFQPVTIEPAAAGVGEPEPIYKSPANMWRHAMDVTVSHTIERCAQWLIENYGNSMRSVAHDMRRALKDKP